jgi:uncharacterized protein HemY
MPIITPPATFEEAYKSGMACLERKTYKEAASYFQTALDLDRVQSQRSRNMKCLSFLGLALNLAHGRSDEGLKMCEQAAKRDFFDPDLFCNLGMVYMRHRQRGPAFAAFKRGLTLRPRDRRILEEMARYDRRARPFFPFLPRDHVANVLFGRLRVRLREFLDRFSPSEA